MIFKKTINFIKFNRYYYHFYDISAPNQREHSISDHTRINETVYTIVHEDHSTSELSCAHTVSYDRLLVL